MNQLTTLINRVLFVGAFILAAFAVWERLANFFGYTTVIGNLYVPGRLLEFSGMALLFVIALQLRDIRHSLMQKKGT